MLGPRQLHLGVRRRQTILILDVGIRRSVPGCSRVSASGRPPRREVCNLLQGWIDLERLTHSDQLPATDVECPTVQKRPGVIARVVHDQPNRRPIQHSGASNGGDVRCLIERPVSQAAHLAGPASARTRVRRTLRSAAKLHPSRASSAASCCFPARFRTRSRPMPQWTVSGSNSVSR